MDQGLVDQIARVDVGEEQNIRVAHDFAAGGTLVAGGLGVDGQIHAQGAVHDAAGDFALLVHLRQLSGLHGGGHFGVDHLNGGQRGHLGALQAAGVGHLDGVGDDAGLVLQGGIGHEGHVGEEEQLLHALDLEHGHMAQGAAGAQADFLVEHALEEGLGVGQTLHVHIHHAVVGQLDRGQGGFLHIGLVDDFKTGQVHADFRGNGLDFGLVAYQNRVGNALIPGGGHGLQHGVVLGDGHGNLLLLALSDLGNQAVKALNHSRSTSIR